MSDNLSTPTRNAFLEPFAEDGRPVAVVRPMMVPRRIVYDSEILILNSPPRSPEPDIRLEDMPSPGIPRPLLRNEYMYDYDEYRGLLDDIQSFPVTCVKIFYRLTDVGNVYCARCPPPQGMGPSLYRGEHHSIVSRYIFVELRAARYFCCVCNKSVFWFIPNRYCIDCPAHQLNE